MNTYQQYKMPTNQFQPEQTTPHTLKTNNEPCRRDNAPQNNLQYTQLKNNFNTYEPKSSTTIWSGSLGALNTFKAAFEDYDNHPPLPKSLLANHLHIVGRVDVAKVDHFIKNRGHRKMYIYGLNVLGTNEIFEQLSAQFMNKQRIGAVEIKSGHIYVVPEGLKNKLNILKNKTYISGHVVIVMIKSVVQQEMPVVQQETQESTYIRNLFDALKYYQHGTPHYPPQLPPLPQFHNYSPQQGQPYIAPQQRQQYNLQPGQQGQPYIAPQQRQQYNLQLGQLYMAPPRHF
jgi:hypothetical protein